MEGNQKKNVFLVEDEEAQMNIWRGFLGKANELKLHIFRDPVEAQNMIFNFYREGKSVDVLVIDHEMPNLVGADLIANIHEFCMANNIDTPDTVLVSAYAKDYLKSELDARSLRGIPILHKSEIVVLRNLVLEFASPRHTPEG